MWSGSQQLRLVSNLCYYMKPAAHTVSVSAAVIAQPQPRGVFFPSCLKNNNNEGNIWMGTESAFGLYYSHSPLCS